MKKIAGAGILSLVVSALLVAAPLTSASAAPSDRDNIYGLTNNLRQSQGLDTLDRNSSLDSVAQNWATYMGETGDYRHQTQSEMAQRIPTGWMRWGENIAYVSSSSTSTDLFNNWVNSPGHYVNIVGDFTDIGVGYYTNTIDGLSYGVQIFADYPPGPPTGQNAPSVSAVDARNVNVSWKAPGSDGGSTVTGYDVYLTRQYDNATVASSSVDANTLSTAFGNLTPGTAYYAFVSAKNAIGNSGFSPSSAVVVTPAVAPSAPTTPVVTAGNQKLTVSWDSPTDNGGAAVTGYTVNLTPAGGAAVALEVGAVNTVDYADFQPGVSYTATVVAKNSAGASPASAASASVISPFKAPGAPAAPTAQVTATAGQVGVTWAAPVNTGGTKITGYTVTITNVNNVADTKTLSTANLSAGFSGLTPGATYTATVSAKNSVGNSPASAASNTVYVLPVAPDAPTSIVAELSDEKQITVTWEAPAYAGGGTISSYVVTLTSQKAGVEKKVVTVNGDSRSAVVEGLASDTTYTATVTAVNETGTSVSSTASNKVVIPKSPVAPDAVAPALISGVTAEGFTFSWVEPASNGGSAITNYNVTVVAADGNKVLDNDYAEPTSVTLDSLDYATGYTVSIVAENRIGNSKGSEVVAYTLAKAPGEAYRLNGQADAKGGLTLNWSAPTDTGGYVISNYAVNLYLAEDRSLVKTVNSQESEVTINGLTPGTDYFYTVVSSNKDATGAESSSSGVITTRDVPAAPTNVVTSVSSENASTVTITWDDVADSDGFIVTLTGDDGKTYTATNESTTTGFAQLTPGVSYTATVQAVNAIGTSAVSAESNVTRVAPVAPDAVTNVKTVVAGTKATVTWNAPAFNGGGTDLRYFVSVANQANNQDVRTGTVTDTTFVAENLTPGAVYDVLVVSANSEGFAQLGGKAVASIAAVAPDAVRDATASLDADRVNSAVVRWNAPEFDGGSKVYEYRVTLTPTTSRGTEQVVAVKADDTEARFSNLTPGATYTTSIEARNKVGFSEVTKADNVAVPATVSSAPVDTAVSLASKSSVKVTWSAPTSDGGADVTGYVVTLVNSNGEKVSSVTVGSVAEYVFSDVVGSESYSATVQAINAAGTSEATKSTSEVDVEPSTTPEAPAADDTQLKELENSEIVEVKAVTDNTITARVSGNSGDWVYAYAYSTPTPLGWAQINADGEASWSLASASLVEGVHTLAVLNEDGTLRGYDDFTVAAVVAPVDPTTPVEPTPGTPADPTTPVTPETPVSINPNDAAVNNGTNPVAVQVTDADVKASNERARTLAFTGSEPGNNIGSAVLLLLAGLGLLGVARVRQQKTAKKATQIG